MRDSMQRATLVELGEQRAAQAVYAASQFGCGLVLFDFSQP
jgi:hypothetical protein